jgi:hypothetical protein
LQTLGFERAVRPHTVLRFIAYTAFVVSVLYFKISNRPASDRKPVNVSVVTVAKRIRSVSKIDYKDLAKVCNPPRAIKHGVEGDIGT